MVHPAIKAYRSLLKETTKTGVGTGGRCQVARVETLGREGKYWVFVDIKTTNVLLAASLCLVTNQRMFVD